ncbi:hypothetical protein M2651_04685 [Clostridium sp. SYSU_GA19001]|uniref:hypothetical protein n=1 Tax=Clostridium caldaquaticum TaxID=2940653 RepID=UPI0020775073|nr:hypothetical protein [Clostridium caldaquaticum]MCM8710322.1 hypothetical protein [Clostridium caldaquaticum]
MIKYKTLIVAIALILVIIQGTLIFRDAMKKNIPYPWLWGIIGLMNIPSSTIIYLVFKTLYFKKKKRS